MCRELVVHHHPDLPQARWALGMIAMRKAKRGVACRNRTTPERGKMTKPAIRRDWRPSWRRPNQRPSWVGQRALRRRRWRRPVPCRRRSRCRRSARRRTWTVHRCLKHLHGSVTDGQVSRSLSLSLFLAVVAAWRIWVVGNRQLWDKMKLLRGSFE